ncbi:hypothetical protein N7532_009993 [Penicillium argentinense]|uniref:SMODS and SLOG-associating 2TM effector domain-containing protein n=1 Tax=Penicillium argentinense TaxID=1131581 RepID=A0A9W9ENT2_9EURO|nr:uncharacterized protein N7532_009993 [Penicillium argentinense]KAJ5085222.1 hypothetical protein N7532_009993 [Penicillium argentinense]
MAHRSNSLLRRVITAALDREENNYPPMAAHAAATRGEAFGNGNPDVELGQAKRFTVATNHPDTLIPPNDKLLIFRALTGIDSVPALTNGGHLLRSAPNVGIYTRVIRNETKAARGYRIFNALINTCLGIQIVVAAAVTALGAASGPHSAVTAFGAINTIMAGILTYLRGSGLPDRLKAYQNKWKNIREYIEQREREFCLVGCDLDVQEEVFIVESMYQSLKSEMETTKSSGEGRSQQPDDPRIRRSLLPTSNHLSGHRNSTTPVTRAEAASPRHPDDHDPPSPITVPEAAIHNEKS